MEKDVMIDLALFSLDVVLAVLVLMDSYALAAKTGKYVRPVKKKKKPERVSI